MFKRQTSGRDHLYWSFITCYRPLIKAYCNLRGIGLTIDIEYELYIYGLTIRVGLIKRPTSFKKTSLHRKAAGHRLNYSPEFSIIIIYFDVLCCMGRIQDFAMGWATCMLDDLNCAELSGGGWMVGIKTTESPPPLNPPLYVYGYMPTSVFTSVLRLSGRRIQEFWKGGGRVFEKAGPKEDLS